MKLTKAQKRIFDKYAIKYDLYEKNDFKSKRNIEQQKYVYKKLKERQIKNTNIEKVLDLLMDDIKIQYELKSHTENRIGFLLALWGIILGTILQNDLIKKILVKIMNTYSNTWSLGIYICLLGLMLVFGTFSLIMFIRALLQGRYARYMYNDKDIIYGSTVDDKEISMTILLESHINIWSSNENNNNQQVERLRKAVYVFIGFIGATILCYLI
ncbi:MAG: hypothetical protein IJ272_10810 [Clostridia bacterium]|nr:hypothetical protein [Clostridia bacterium]